jgi:aminoglycoside 6'-N-acetyltransferase I
VENDRDFGTQQQHVIIRRATPSDYEEWLRLRRALWPDTSVEEHHQEMADFLREDAEMVVFVGARPDGRLGGFVEAGTRPYAEGCSTSPVGYVEGWYVDPDLRRTGVGRALVEAAEAWARERGLREMASDALIDNEVSYQAHLALGYREVERIICFHKDLQARKREV